MQRRSWIVGGVVAVAAVALVGWRVVGDAEDPEPWVATLTQVQQEDDQPYAYPQWWSDTDHTVRLATVGDDLVVDTPVGTGGSLGADRAVLRAPVGAEPQAVAALPGGSGAPWVAVSLEPRASAPEDAATIGAPLTWTGTGLVPDDPAVDAVRLPVELRRIESGEDVIGTDAAVVRLGESDLAIVTTTQRDAGTLHTCEVGDCRWSERALPGDQPVDAVASTGSGVVAVTGQETDEAAVWYAADADLTWQQVGSAPAGSRLGTVQDGAGQVALVWLDRAAPDVEDEDDTVAVQLLSHGRIDDVVDRWPVDGALGRVHTVLQDDGRWYLGGERETTARVALGPSSLSGTEATVWELADSSWRPLQDALLRHQPFQTIRGLAADPQGDLVAVSTSAVLGTTLSWRFSRGER